MLAQTYFFVVDGLVSQILRCRDGRFLNIIRNTFQAKLEIYYKLVSAP